MAHMNAMPTFLQTSNPSPKAAILTLRHSFALDALPPCNKDDLSF